MRKIGCNEQAVAKLEDGTPLPEVSSPHPLYRAFSVDQPDGTIIRAYCENSAGISEIVPITLPEAGGIALVLGVLLVFALWRRRGKVEGS